LIPWLDSWNGTASILRTSAASTSPARTSSRLVGLVSSSQRRTEAAREQTFASLALIRNSLLQNLSYATVDSSLGHHSADSSLGHHSPKLPNPRRDGSCRNDVHARCRLRRHQRVAPKPTPAIGVALIVRMARTNGLDAVRTGHSDGWKWSGGIWPYGATPTNQTSFSNLGTGFVTNVDPS
jgi:hypothetical protein